MHVFGLWENTMADHQEMCIRFSDTKICKTATHRKKKTQRKKNVYNVVCIIV
jgi:hypothetical protein